MDRIERVLERLKGEGISQMLITDKMSIFYLTGVFVEPGERFLGLYINEGGAKTLIVNRLFSVPDTDCQIVWLRDTDSVSQAVAGLADSSSPLGVDKQCPARFLLPIRDAMPRCRLLLASQCVDWVRAVKEPEEQEKMIRASEINDLVMGETAAYIHEGCTEKEVADYLVSRYYAHGCEGISFEPIVSFGANAADPHHMPDNTVVRKGDCIVVDIGCLKDGYCSDMTRTFFFKEAPEEYTAIHDLVRRANEKAESMIRPGVRLCDIDAAARDTITEAGYGEYFTHRLGHFIGMEVHEYGDVSAAFDNTVREGMCFSCEPGVYLPGKFGVRVEDLVLVTADGCRVLNSYPKIWQVIGQDK